MKLRFQAPPGQWIKATTDVERIMAHALTRAMKDVADTAVSLGNQNIHSAGFKSKKWELKAKRYPSGGKDSLAPEVWLHSQVNFMEVFEEGRIIEGSPFLWLPLPSVPKWPGDPTRQMSPKKYVQTVGPLRTMHRPSGAPMLGAVIFAAPKAQPWGRFATKAQLKKGLSAKFSTKRIIQVIPMFVGVPAVSIQKKLDILPTTQKAFDMFQTFYLENLEPVSDLR